MHVRTPEKRAAFTALLANGITALHMDARVAGLRVPAHLRDRSWLVLNFSYGYQLSDFNFDDDGVEASLSFGGRPFPCFVPWEAVFAMSDESRDTFHVWQEDMPPEAVASLADASAAVDSPSQHTEAEALITADRPSWGRAPAPAPAPASQADAATAGAVPADATTARDGATGRKRPTFGVIDGGGERSSGRGGHLERIK